MDVLFKRRAGIFDTLYYFYEIFSRTFFQTVFFLKTGNHTDTDSLLCGNTDETVLNRSVWDYV